MITRSRVSASKLMYLVPFLIAPGTALATVTFEVDIHTADEFRATFSGTFDADAAGDQHQWLAIKSDWTSNYGVNSEWILGYTGAAITISSAAGLTVIENSLRIDGFVPTATNLSGNDAWGDSVYFDAGFSITAGMPISGSIHLEGVGYFDPGAELELLSGFDNAALDWNALVASAGPSDGPSVEFTGTCPGVVVIDMSGFTPAGTIAILKGSGPGGMVLPGSPCVGTPTGLAGLGLVTTITADAAGEATVAPNLSAGACGAWLQMLDLATCLLAPAQAIP